MTRLLRAVLVAIALAPSGAAAGGLFMLEEHGARSSGRAGAVVATVVDGSAIAFNPAGLGFSEGWVVELGASVISPSAELFAENGSRFGTEETPLFTPNVYAHGRPFDFLAFGVGVTTPFETNLRWQAGTPGTDAALRQQLRATFFSMAAAFNTSRWLDGLAVGAGIDLVPATYEPTREVPFGNAVGSAQLGTTAFGVGGRAGIVYRPPFVPGLRSGLTWRSEVDLGFSGLADFDAAAPYRAALPPDGSASTHIVLPQSLLFGAAYRFGPLEIELDLGYTNWQRLGTVEVALPGGEIDVMRRDLRDTASVRIGGELNFVPLDLDLRAGYAFDASPVRPRSLDLLQPDADRHSLSAGATYYLPFNMFLDAGVTYTLPNEKRTRTAGLAPEVKGTYKVSALAAAFSLGVRLDGDPRPTLSYPMQSGTMLQPTQK